ncbi:putative reverse transcriptase domain-containing protein [Tanacetum coccineum]
MEDGLGCGLHLNVDKLKFFLPKEDPRSRLAGIFPPNIALPLHGVKLLGGPASVDFDFCNELVMKRPAGLQTRLFWHIDIVSPEPIFDDALSCFNTSMETDLLSNLQSTFLYLLDRWPCGLLKGRIIPLTGLGQSLFPSRTYYELCSRVFSEDIYGDHVVSCVGILGIKHRHNVVPYTLVDICYRSGISAGKEVDISGIKDLMCVDMTGYSPLTQTGMVDFVPGQAVIVAAQRELGELEADAVTLLKRIRKFSITQDIGARPGDFLAHHAIALGLHTTTLILVKGALDARGSKLMPDKKDFGSVRWPRTRRYL